MSTATFVYAVQFLEWPICIKRWDTKILSYFSPFLFHLLKSIFSQNFASISFSSLYKYYFPLCNFSSLWVPFPICYILQLVISKIKYYELFVHWGAYCVPGTVIPTLPTSLPVLIPQQRWWHCCCWCSTHVVTDCLCGVTCVSPQAAELEWSFAGLYPEHLLFSTIMLSKIRFHFDKLN